MPGINLATIGGHPAIMADVVEVGVVVAHRERATLRVARLRVRRAEIPAVRLAQPSFDWACNCSADGGSLVPIAGGAFRSEGTRLKEKAAKAASSAAKMNRPR